MRRVFTVALASVALVGLSGVPAGAEAQCEGPINVCPELGILPVGPIPVGPIPVSLQIGPNNFELCIPIPLPGVPPCPK